MCRKNVLTIVAVAILALSASAGAAEVTIVNPGFEDSVLGDGDYNYQRPGWGWFGTDAVGTWNPGLPGTAEPAYGGNAPEGENIGWAEPIGGFAQVLTETLTADMTYTLTVEVGNALGYAWGGYKVQLLAGGTPGDTGEITVGIVLAEDDNSLTTIAEDTFETSTVTYTYNPALHSGSLGEPLQIRLLAPGGDGVDFDDVKLDAAGPGPIARNPDPEDGATDVPPDVSVGWKPGIYAPAINGHKVYFGESFDDVNDGVGGVTQDANSYTPAQRLDFGTTYYWKVDEANSTTGWDEGDVWSFTTEPFAYPIDGNNITATASSTYQADAGPENTINGSGLDANDLHSMEPTDMWLSGDEKEPNRAWIEYELDKVCKLHEMWVWNYNTTMEFVLGFGFKDVTIEYSTNGTDYTILGTTHEFVRAPGLDDYAHNTTVDFGGTAAKYVRLTANSNWGGILTQYGLSEVRFLHIPVHAREPSPDSGATDVAVDVSLGFRAGREAVTHDVHLSTNEQAVIDSNALVSTVTEAGYGPLSLDLGTTYYWKINEVNVAETPTTWQGDIWNFTTREFFIVDDFENYNDYSPDEIWSTWIDGYGDPANGATSGYPEPIDFPAGEHYMETTIVHGGDQSMPFLYDNTGTATYSEGKRTFAVPQDWTKAGVQTLALYFYGSPGNTGQLYVEVNGFKVVYPGDAGNLALAGWQAWNIEVALFDTNLQSVTTLAIGIDDNGASGTLYFDDIRLYARSRQLITPAEPNNTGLVGHWKFEEASGTLFDQSDNHNDGTSFQSVLYHQTGQVGYALGFDGIDDYVVVGTTGTPTDTFSFGGWLQTSATHEIDGESISGTFGTAGQRYAFDPAHGGDADGGAGLSVGTNGILVYEHGSSYMPATAVYQADIGNDWNHIIDSL